MNTDIDLEESIEKAALEVLQLTEDIGVLEIMFRPKTVAALMLRHDFDGIQPVIENALALIFNSGASSKQCAIVVHELRKEQIYRKVKEIWNERRIRSN